MPQDSTRASAKDFIDTEARASDSDDSDFEEVHRKEDPSVEEGSSDASDPNTSGEELDSEDEDDDDDSDDGWSDVAVTSEDDEEDKKNRSSTRKANVSKQAGKQSETGRTGKTEKKLAAKTSDSDKKATSTSKSGGDKTPDSKSTKTVTTSSEPPKKTFSAASTKQEKNASSAASTKQEKNASSAEKKASAKSPASSEKAPSKASAKASAKLPAKSPAKASAKKVLKKPKEETKESMDLEEGCKSPDERDKKASRRTQFHVFGSNPIKDGVRNGLSAQDEVDAINAYVDFKLDEARQSVFSKLDAQRKKRKIPRYNDFNGTDDRIVSNEALELLYNAYSTNHPLEKLKRASEEASQKGFPNKVTVSFGRNFMDDTPYIESPMKRAKADTSSRGN